MKFISLLLALLCVAALAYQLLGTGHQSPTALTAGTKIPTPQVPKTVNEVKAFENEMESFIQETAQARKEQVERAQH